MAKKIKHKEQFLNFNLVVFGGTGDLALRKIYPALYQRYIDGQLNCKYNIIAITRKTDQEKHFRSQVQLFLEKSLEGTKGFDTAINEFMSNIQLVIAKEPSVQGYKGLKGFLENFKGYQNIYYFSTPSGAFRTNIESIKRFEIS
jgi:glucose-6-phosphate 1-dehydrogenase